MALINQVLTENYAAYNGDCVEVMQDLPDGKIHLSVYSPPFGGLYRYSSDDRDVSNSHDYDTFFDHYGFVVKELSRITMPGRITAVHCMDVPTGNSGKGDAYLDFPGDIIRLHAKHGFDFIARHAIWKEPLWVRNRTMQKNLAHMTAVQDSTLCGVASADYLLVFRKRGENPVPVANPVGFLYYAGDDSKMPDGFRELRGMAGDQKLNRFSHWIWRRYASSIWDDIRMNRILKMERIFDETDENHERHVHPLQLDVIDRIVQMRSNLGETVFTPFMGVGSECYSALTSGRKAMGVELKSEYYDQAVANMASAKFGEPGVGALDAQTADIFDEGENI